MSLDSLQQLVSQYAENKIDHAHFRKQFVSQFLSIRCADGLDALVNSVDSACADYSEELIGEAVLKGRIARIALPTQVAMIFNISFTAGGTCQDQNVNRAMWASATNPSDSIEASDSAASNQVQALELSIA